MSNRKATFFYGFLIAVASLAAGMVLASRLERLGHEASSVAVQCREVLGEWQRA